MQRILEGLEMAESAVSLDIFHFSSSNIFSTTCFIFPSNFQMIVLDLRQTCCFWKSNIGLADQIEKLIGQICQSTFSFEICRFSHLSFSNTTHLKFLSRSEFRVRNAKILSDGSFTNSVPYLGLLTGWTCEEAQIFFLFCRVSDSGLKSFTEAPIKMFFCECLYTRSSDLLLVRSITHAPFWRKMSQCNYASWLQIPDVQDSTKGGTPMKVQLHGLRQ